MSGPIPAALGDLANLEYLGLCCNRAVAAGLAGPIPAALGNLANLRQLRLGGNWLSGPIPAALGNLANLRELGLGGNRLSAPIPSALGSLANLVELSLWWNALSGPIPSELGRLTNLYELELYGNHLTGPIPSALGDLPGLRSLSLAYNDLAGPVPARLGRLADLESLDLSFNWGLSGPLPAGLELPRLDELDILVTRACAPAAWRDRLAAVDFNGRLCGDGTGVTIDVAIFHTPAARERAGGAAGIAAVIDLMVAETNQAYAASGVRQRLALVERSEVQYVESGIAGRDLGRLANPADGHMDEVHALRDRAGADLVHLIVGESNVAGRAQLGGAFGLSLSVGGLLLAHELGHNMGLSHDRYEAYGAARGHAHPGHGYVNQRGLEAGPRSSRWATIMAYFTQCRDAYSGCGKLLRFSNPRQRYNGDPLGVPFGEGSGAAGPADAVAVLDTTGPAVALWRDRPARANRPPTAAGTLPDRRLTLHGTLTVDVSPGFVDPDGDPLTYAVSSSAPDVVTVRAAGARVTLTAVGEGTAMIRVTATDPGGLSAAQRFTVMVSAAPAPFTDDPLRPGVTPIRAVHFTELRTRIDALRAAAGLAPFRWTDSVLRAGVTRVRLAHLLELREALAAAYAAAGRPAPRWTDAAPVGGTTPIRAAHLTELRAAVVALE